VFVLAPTGLASAAQLSGTITDHWTGAPIEYAQLTVDLVRAGEGAAAGLEEGRPVARPETDAAGHWEAQVQPGVYWIFVEAGGYYTQGLGAPTGNNGTVEIKVGEGGLSLDAQMVPNGSPFIGLFPAVMRWTHEPKQGFRTMVLTMEYGGFAAIPSGWPYQHLVTEVTDAKGRPVWPKAMTRTDLVPPGGEGEGGTDPMYGSASGCEFYNSTKERPNVEHLYVVSYLESNPSIRAEEQIVPDRSECSQTQLEIWNPQIFGGRRVRMMLGATIEDRLPEEKKVPGVMRFVVNGHKPIYVRVRNATEPEFTSKGSSQIHPGRNKVAVSFKPSVDTVTAPAPKRLGFNVPRSDFRHRH
jgi:hypothetical protein